jgi:hypothetical protein
MMWADSKSSEALKRAVLGNGMQGGAGPHVHRGWAVSMCAAVSCACTVPPPHSAALLPSVELAPAQGKSHPGCPTAIATPALPLLSPIALLPPPSTVDITHPRPTCELAHPLQHHLVLHHQLAGGAHTQRLRRAAHTHTTPIIIQPHTHSCNRTCLYASTVRTACVRKATRDTDSPTPPQPRPNQDPNLLPLHPPGSPAAWGPLGPACPT